MRQKVCSTKRDSNGAIFSIIQVSLMPEKTCVEQSTFISYSGLRLVALAVAIYVLSVAVIADKVFIPVTDKSSLSPAWSIQILMVWQLTNIFVQRWRHGVVFLRQLSAVCSSTTTQFWKLSLPFIVNGSVALGWEVKMCQAPFLQWHWRHDNGPKVVLAKN